MPVQLQQSYATAAEDLIVAKYFPPDYVGTYVDIGCWQPVEASNTYYFYQRGWCGLCIDAADFAAAYKAERPHDTFVQTGVGSAAGTLPYYVISQDTSANTFDKHQAEALRVTRGFAYTETQVPVQPLAAILAAHGVQQTDFVNIDVEGMDLAILQQIDFAALRPRVVAIEDLALDMHNPVTSPIVRHMEEHGYLFHSKCYCTSIFVLPLVANEVEKLKLALRHRGHA